MEKTKEREMTCKNPKCKYKWAYTGEHKFYCTCPRCLRKVPIPKTEEN